MHQKAAMREQLQHKIETMKPCDATLFKRIVDFIGPVKEWPLHTITDMLSTHLTYGSRVGVTLFALGNTCPPDAYAQWLVQRKMLHDASARMHVANLIKDHKMGLLHKFTTYMLPFRVTINKPIAERRHKWDGVGDPVPMNAPSSAFLYNVELPNGGFMEKEGWRWDAGYKLLTGTTPIGFHPAVAAALDGHPQVKIVQMRNPDSDDDEMQTDVYGTPVAAYTTDSMDTQTALYEMTHLNKRGTPGPILQESIAMHLAKKIKTTAGSSSQLVPPREEDGEPRAVYFTDK